MLCYKLVQLNGTSEAYSSANFTTGKHLYVQSNYPLMYVKLA